MGFIFIRDLHQKFIKKRVWRETMNEYFDKISNQGYYIIAEVGVNYYEIAEQNNISVFEAAKLMMKRAKENGADAVKYQTYKAQNLTIKDSPGSWDKKDISVDTQYELFQMYDKFGENEYRELSEYAKEVGIMFLSTPFDLESVEYLDEYMDVYKISSADIRNIPLMKAIAKKGKPIILSVGASEEVEIEQAVNLIRANNDKQLTLLHCVLEYPTPYEHANLLKIKSLADKYKDIIVGYSDHTKPDSNMDVLKTAYILGARVIEKHFTLDKTIKNKNDHFHSMDCEDIRSLKKGLEFCKQIMGSPELKCLESEVKTRQSVRRSAVSNCEIRKGQILTDDLIIYKRPASGLSPYEVERIIGKMALVDIPADTVLKEEQFSI